MIKKVGKHEIEIYDDIQDMNWKRFQKFNKYSMKANEVGSTFGDFDSRTAKTLEFLAKDMVPEAIQELSNRRLTVFNAYNENDIQGKAFICLIKRIDDVHYTTSSPGDLEKVDDHLDKIGLSYINSLTILNDVKKKSKLNWKRIFLKNFRTKNSKNKTF
jgi:hypothetical protein